MAISNSEYARAKLKSILLNDQIQDADYTDPTENAVKSGHLQSGLSTVNHYVHISGLVTGHNYCLLSQIWSVNVW